MNDLNESYGAMLSRPDAIYISKDFLDVVNSQSCDCCRLIIKSGDRYIRLTSEPVGEDGRIIFEEISSFEESEYPYEAELNGAEFTFDKFCYLENGMIDGIRFAADGVFLFVFASEHNLILTMSKYDLFEEIKMDFPEKEATLTLVHLDEGFDELYFVKNDGKAMTVMPWRTSL